MSLKNQVLESLNGFIYSANVFIIPQTEQLAIFSGFNILHHLHSTAAV